MTLQSVLTNAFSMMREHPRIFLPRLIMTAVWSIFWIAIVGLLQNPLSATLQDIFLLSIVATILTPLQIWVFNTYVVIVKQHNSDTIRLRTAFHDGMKKLPQGIAVFALLGTMMLVFGTPGAILFMYGTMQASLWLQAIGVLVSGGAVIGVVLLTYFAPVSAIIGEKSFFQNVKDGISTSREERQHVFFLTLLSFTSLLFTQTLQGGLEYLGLIGFFGGRFIAAIISVYVLIVNPELFLRAQKE